MPNSSSSRTANSKLDVDRLNTALCTAPVGHTVVYHPEVGSTMDIARQLAASPTVRSGTLVCTESQSAGRGRRRQVWHAPAHTSLLLSFILKQDMLPYGIDQLSMRVAVATITALRAFLPEMAPRFWLKWPNDVLSVQPDSDPAKIAGLLVETAFHGSTLASAILGTGINVNQRADQLPPPHPATVPAGSLYLLTGARQDRTALLIELCRVLGCILENANKQQIFTQWRSMLHTLDKPVHVYSHSVASSTGPARPDLWLAHAVDVTPNGDLVLRDEDGKIQVVQATEVSIRTTEAPENAP